MLLLWQLLIEMLFLTKLQENLCKNFRGIRNFRFWRVLCQWKCKIWWYFSNSKTKKNHIHVAIAKNIQRLQRARYAFLDQSKTLVLSDVIKIEILFKYSGAYAIRTYSSRAKKTTTRHLWEDNINICMFPGHARIRSVGLILFSYVAGVVEIQNCVAWIQQQGFGSAHIHMNWLSTWISRTDSLTTNIDNLIICPKPTDNAEMVNLVKKKPRQLHWRSQLWH